MRGSRIIEFYVLLNTLILLYLLKIFTNELILNIPLFLLSILMILEIITLIFGSHYLLRSKRHCPECGINITNYTGHKDWSEPIKEWPIKAKAKLQRRKTQGQFNKKPHYVFQITIPKFLAESLNWKKRDIVIMRMKGKELRMEKKSRGL